MGRNFPEGSVSHIVIFGASKLQLVIPWYFSLEILFICLFFLMKVNKGRDWREILVKCKREKSKRGVSQNCVLPLPKLLSNALPLVPTDKLVHPCMHADIWVSAALQCTSKSPSSDKLCKMDKHFNANPLNVIFIQLCTTCLWIKNILLKRSCLSYGTGRQASCTCLSLVAWTIVQ